MYIYHHGKTVVRGFLAKHKHYSIRSMVKKLPDSLTTPIKQRVSPVGPQYKNSEQILQGNTPEYSVPVYLMKKKIEHTYSSYHKDIQYEYIVLPEYKC